MKKKTEQNAAGAPQTGKTAGAGAAGFLKKNWKWLVPVACVAVLGGVWLLKPKADKPASVDTSYVETAPEQRDLVNALSGTGTLKPANTYNVKSLVSGKVLTCSFEEGDNVEEGDVLYTVDSSDATTKVEQAGITLFLLSNSRRPGRAQHYAEALGIPYEGHAGKPKSGGFRRALARMNAAPEEAAIVGDQIFTDILGGNRAGVLTLLVHPIRFGTVFRLLRFGIETPFRAGAEDGRRL